MLQKIDVWIKSCSMAKYFILLKGARYTDYSVFSGVEHFWHTNPIPCDFFKCGLQLLSLLYTFLSTERVFSTNQHHANWIPLSLPACLEPCWVVVRFAHAVSDTTYIYILVCIKNILFYFQPLMTDYIKLKDMLTLKKCFGSLLL